MLDGFFLFLCRMYLCYHVAIIIVDFLSSIMQKRKGGQCHV